MTSTWLRKPLPAALIFTLLWTVFRLAILWHTGIPRPEVHDEFSYLLGADTFVHGRLANPPHLLGRFFESPHVLVRPVYASKYPPGQAMFLALGQRLFGSPFFGVLIGNALMLFTLCLMLYAWVPPPWALAVSGMFGLCLAPPMYWTTSYWGGSVAASGGALVLLGIGIYRSKPTVLAGTIFAAGALLLFWTRPFEGGVFTLAVLSVFAGEIWRARRAGPILAAVLVFAIGGVWTCFDNLAVTGSPFHLPYLLHDHQYNTTPVFWILPMRPQPAYSNPRIAAENGAGGFEAGQYSAYRHGNGIPWHSFQFPGTGLINASFIGFCRSVQTISFLRIAILLALLVPVAWRDRLYRKMAIVVGVVLLALTAETFHYEHYTAPAWAALALLIAVWARHAWNLRIFKQRVGVVLVLCALASPLLVHLLPHLAGLMHRASRSTIVEGGIPQGPHYGSEQRPALIAQLSALGQPQLVIVRYPLPAWRIEEEWVYNGADIDGQKVVFAHDLGAEDDRALLAYYPDRTVWLLTFDSATGKANVDPYPRDSANIVRTANSR